MATKRELQDWVIEALKQLGGHGTVVQVSKVIWNNHEEDLRNSGNLFFTWQYDVRWAAQVLQEKGKLKKGLPVRGQWSLTGA